MKEIEFDSWKRKEHYSFFSRMDYPHFNICFDLDITKAYRRIKDGKFPFYYTMIYLAVKSTNDVEEFRYRSRSGKIILHDKLNPAFTYMDSSSDLFKMIVCPMDENVRKFTETASLKAVNQKEYFLASDFDGKDDYVYITSIPWISFTHISHTIKLGDDDCVPRISWGKYFESGSKIMLPFSVQVNHAFADGIHIGRYKEILGKNMSEFAEG